MILQKKKKKMTENNLLLRNKFCFGNRFDKNRLIFIFYSFFHIINVYLTQNIYQNHLANKRICLCLEDNRAT